MSQSMRLLEKVLPMAGGFDVYDNLKPSAVLDLFQDIAGRHADLLGLGYTEMLEKERLWVLLRTCYEVDHYPAFGETVNIATWPQQGRLDFDRHYIISGLDGQTYIRGRSKWCVIDSATRRLVKDTRVSYPGECLTETVVDQVEKVVPLPDGELLCTFSAGLSDLDHNGHMNNTRYADLVHNALGYGDAVKRFNISYIHELKVGDCVSIYRKRDNTTVTVWGELDGRACFAAQLELYGGDK